MEMSLSPTGWAVWLLLAFAASAQALVHPVRRGTLRHQPAMAAEEENEESKEILGAAALGAISAIAVTDEVGMGIITAAAFAYGATMANGAGKAARVGGRAVFKAYETGIDINVQRFTSQLLPLDPKSAPTHPRWPARRRSTR